MAQNDILLIEDNPKLAASLKEGLEDAGYKTHARLNGADGLGALDEITPGLILLDLGLPDIDGLDLFVQLKERLPEIPVMIITARGSLEDRVRGLDLGSDDYLVKPFAFPELVARVRAVMRRTDGVAKTALKHGKLELDITRRVVAVGDQDLDLPLREFSLLQYLLENRGDVVSRDMLATNVWKINRRATSLDNAIDVHISRLRSKLKEAGMGGMLKTVRGSGFTIEKIDA